MSLATAYRPDQWDYVSGHTTHIKAIRRLTAKADTHAFLLTGDSGLGKTTIARLIAADLSCAPQNLEEYDGSSRTGVDAWREVGQNLQYAPIGGGSRVIVVDECQGLSKQAWGSLLKVIEEPPAHTYWVFCTTEPTKVPKAIVTRCATFALKPVRSDALAKLVDEVAHAESFVLVPEVRALIIKECHGSPRQALAYLECAHDCETAEQAAELIETAAPPGTPRDLAGGLVNGHIDWPRCVKLVKSMQDSVTAETLRRVVVAYASAVMLNRDSRAACEPLLAIISVFGSPFASDAKAAEILIPVARLLK